MAEQAVREQRIYETKARFTKAEEQLFEGTLSDRKAVQLSGHPEKSQMQRPYSRVTRRIKYGERSRHKSICRGKLFC